MFFVFVFSIPMIAENVSQSGSAIRIFLILERVVILSIPPLFAINLQLSLISGNELVTLTNKR